MSTINNLSAYGKDAPLVELMCFADPFADTGNLEDSGKNKADYIHIRIQQRNGRKTLTTLQGLPKEFDQKRLLKHFKKDFACNGNIVEDEEMGEVIQLQGDQRVKIQDFLVGQKIAVKTMIKVHGF